MRVLGTILTWLQEKKKPVFVVGTANDVSALPPELLRKGRFDEIFFVDLPTVAEREEIVKIHLNLRDLIVKDFDIAKIGHATDSFGGAEIEQVIVDAMFSAFSKDLDVTTKDILAAAAATTPISKTMEAKITALRTWAETRARKASDELPSERKSTPVGRAAQLA